MQWRPLVALTLSALCLAGCGSLASRAAGGIADQLATAILDQDDPALVAEALPAYLVLLDSAAAGPDPDPAVSGAAARLYAAYAVVFVTDPERAAVLGARARRYGDAALCSVAESACDFRAQPFETLGPKLAELGEDEAAALYSQAVGSLAYVRTHADDWEALTDLPRIEATLKRLEAIAPAADRPTVVNYLGVLNTLRPPALGGKPEVGRAYFEQAIALSGGKDLGIKVEFARQYARLVYDRELHDRLLNEVLAAEPRVPGYTLFNTLAQRTARDLLATADEYF
jgi:hypothetical protein